jgi:hypothetical protein
VEDPHAVANLLHLLEKVGAQKDRQTAGFKIEDQIANLTRSSRVNSCCRLVEYEQARLLDQSLSEADTLKHPF